MAKLTRRASYIGELSSGYESDTVKEYDPSEDELALNARGEGQLGKGHTEEVAPSNNWGMDQRDSIGRAASKKKKIALKLRRIAREIEALKIQAQELDGDYEEKIDEIQDTSIEEATGKTPKEMECFQDEEVESSDEDKKVASRKISKDEYIVIEASHPIEHTKMDNPEANMSAQTGDEEWINIGEGTFDDQRDTINRAASKRK